MSEKNFIDPNTLANANTATAAYGASPNIVSYQAPRNPHVPSQRVGEHNPNLVSVPHQGDSRFPHGGINTGDNFDPLRSNQVFAPQSKPVVTESRIPQDTPNNFNANPNGLGTIAPMNETVYRGSIGRVDGTFAMPRPVHQGNTRAQPSSLTTPSQMMPSGRWSVPNPLAAFEPDPADQRPIESGDQSQGHKVPSQLSFPKQFPPAASSSMPVVPQAPGLQHDRSQVVNHIAPFSVNPQPLDSKAVSNGNPAMMAAMSRPPQAPLPVSQQQFRSSNTAPQSMHVNEGIIPSADQISRFPRVATTYAEMKAQRELMKQRQHHDLPSSVDLNEQPQSNRPPQQLQSVPTYGNQMIQAAQSAGLQQQAPMTDIQMQAQREIFRRRQIQMMEQNHPQVNPSPMNQNQSESMTQSHSDQMQQNLTKPTQSLSDQRFSVPSQQPPTQYLTNSFTQMPEQQGPHQILNQPGKIQLSSEGRQALTKAILSALQSPTGTIEPALLRNAVDLTGLKENAIISAGIAAKHREQLKKLATLPTSSTTDGVSQDEMPQVSAPLRANVAQLNRDMPKRTEPLAMQVSRTMGAPKPAPMDANGKITLVGGSNIKNSAASSRSGVPSVYSSPAYTPGSIAHISQAPNTVKTPMVSNIAKPVEYSKSMNMMKGMSSAFPPNMAKPKYDLAVAPRGNSVPVVSDTKKSFPSSVINTAAPLDQSKLQRLPSNLTNPTPPTSQVTQPLKTVPANTSTIPPQLVQELSNWRRVQQAMFLSNAANVKGINFTHKVSQTPSWSAAPFTIGAVVRCSDIRPISLTVERRVPKEALHQFSRYVELNLLRKAGDLQKALMKSDSASSVVLHTTIMNPDESTNLKRRDLIASTTPLLDLTDKYKRLKLQPRKDAKLLERNLKKSRTLTSDSLNRKLKEIHKSISSHSNEFFKFHRNRKLEVSRLARSVRDSIADKSKKKDKDEENAERARIAALKANDMVAYTALLEERRHDRLKFLLDKTGDFMSKISHMINDKRNGDEDGLTNNHLGGEGGTQSYYSSAHVKNETVKQPSLLTGGSLKDYQLGGLQWLVSLYNNRLNGILADEMGLGKTVQTIALIAYLMEFKDNRGPYLVIVPLSTMSNWVNEFRRWCPSVTVVVYKGTPAQRKELYKDEVREGHFNVLLTTYEYIIRDKSSLRKIPWQYAIVDEGHRMKNAHSKFSCTLGSQYNTSHRLLLTGTPLQNNLPELWALLNFLLPSIFNSVETFDQWFNKPFSQFGGSTSENGADEVLSNEERLLIINRLHELLRPFMLRRIKADVLDQLPDKIERVLRCELSSWQKALYRQISYKVLENGLKTSARGLNNVAMQLRKVCNHPYMFSQEGYYINHDIIRTAGKVELLDRMLPKLKAGGHRILMFFQMTGTMTILEDYFKFRGYLTLRLDGSTPGEEREKRMALFNAPDSPFFIFMLSTRAGGLGLNLASADTVIIFDSDWNVPMMDLQAQDRAHRIGQKKIVTVFRLVTNSPVEEKILNRATEKLNMSEIIVEAGKFDKSSVEEDTSLERFKLMELLLTDFDSNPKVASSTLESSDDEGEGDQDGGEGETEVDFNELLSRNDEDYELYRKIDSGEYKSDELFESAGLITNPGDIPDWIRYPSGKPEDATIDEAALGHRAAKAAVSYNDGLTDHQFMKLMEKQADADEVASNERKRQWLEKRVGGESGTVASSTVTNGPKSDLTMHATNPLPDVVIDRLISICKSVIALKEDKTKRRRSDIFREKPCPQTYPDYYSIIKHPIAINDILQKCRAKAYSSVAEFLKDWEIMFANAKTYNGEGSWIVLDGMELDAELKRLVLKNNLSEKTEPQKSALRIKISLKSTKDTSDQPEASKRKADQSLSPKVNKKARLI